MSARVQKKDRDLIRLRLYNINSEIYNQFSSSLSFYCNLFCSAVVESYAIIFIRHIIFICFFAVVGYWRRLKCYAHVRSHAIWYSYVIHCNFILFCFVKWQLRNANTHTHTPKNAYRNPDSICSMSLFLARLPCKWREFTWNFLICIYIFLFSFTKFA